MDHQHGGLRQGVSFRMGENGHLYEVDNLTGKYKLLGSNNVRLGNETFLLNEAGLDRQWQKKTGL